MYQVVISSESEPASEPYARPILATGPGGPYGPDIDIEGLKEPMSIWTARANKVLVDRNYAPPSMVNSPKHGADLAVDGGKILMTSHIMAMTSSKLACVVV